MWLGEVLILLNSSSSAELQRFSNICTSDFPDNVHKSERTALCITASIRCRWWSSTWQPWGPRTACHLVSRRNHLCPRSGASSRHYFSPEAIQTASTAHDKLFSSCAANSVFSFDVVRCPCSHFDITPPKSIPWWTNEWMNEWLTEWMNDVCVCLLNVGASLNT